MTCKDVMTANPACCVPDDRAIHAAALMKTENVGPIPVVLSTADPRVVGIVTDRDLIVRVVAAGRTPESVPISEIMTPNPVTCREDDDVHSAMEAMSREQVRRIPVVNGEGRLAGIIAQADIARRLDDREAGEVLEDISQPGHNSVGRAFRHTEHALQRLTGNESGTGSGYLFAAGVGMLIGAGLMALAGPTIEARWLARHPCAGDLAKQKDEFANGADEIGGGSLFS